MTIVVPEWVVITLCSLFLVKALIDVVLKIVEKVVFRKLVEEKIRAEVLSHRN